MRNSESPFFSVIIPMYNVEDRIEIAVRGLQKQTCQAFEVHLVDDQSTDRTLNVATSLCKGDSKFRVHALSVNSGAGPARNKGVEFAGGKYLLFHDADDWLDKNALHSLKEHIEDQSYPDVTIFQYVVFNRNKEIILKTNKSIERLPRELDGVSSFKAICKGDLNPTTWNKVFKRSTWQENNLNFQASFIYEDLAFIPYALLFMKTVTICNDARYCYYHNAEGVTYELSDRQAHASLAALSGLQELLQTSLYYPLILHDFTRLAFHTFHHNFFFADRKDSFTDQQIIIYMENILRFCKNNSLKIVHVLSNDKALELIEELFLQIRTRGLPQPKYELSFNEIEDLMDHYTVMARQVKLNLSYSGDLEQIQNDWLVKENTLTKRIRQLKRKNERLKRNFFYWFPQSIGYWFKKFKG